MQDSGGHQQVEGALSITREYANGKITLITHMNGGRTLTREFPANYLKWTVRFAQVPEGTKLLQGDEEALLARANKLGRPLNEEEVMTELLARRLNGRTSPV